MNKVSKVGSCPLIKKGHELLTQRCLHKITDFPVSDEVLETIDLCKEGLRTPFGFWAGKSMSIAATQVGKPQVPLFLMCSRENWNTARQYKTFQTFINPRIIGHCDRLCLAWEGCISDDAEMCLVERPASVKAKFQDTKGEEFEVML